MRSSAEKKQEQKFESVASLGGLPPETLRHIASYSTNAELASLLRVRKDFHENLQYKLDLVLLQKKIIAMGYDPATVEAIIAMEVIQDYPQWLRGLTRIFHLERYKLTQWEMLALSGEIEAIKKAIVLNEEGVKKLPDSLTDALEESQSFSQEIVVYIDGSDKEDDHSDIGGDVYISETVQDQEDESEKKETEVSVPALTKYLVEIGKKKHPLLRGSYDSNLLHYVALSGRLNAMKYLIVNFELSTSDFHLYDVIGRTVLHYAVLSGSVELLDFLVQCDNQKLWTEKSYQSDFTDVTVMHFAAQSGSVDMIKYIQRHCKILLDAKDSRGTNVLHYAAFGGSVPAMQYLVANSGIETDSVSRVSLNAGQVIHFALLGNSVDTTQYAYEKLQNNITFEEGGWIFNGIIREVGQKLHNKRCVESKVDIPTTPPEFKTDLECLKKRFKYVPNRSFNEIMDFYLYFIRQLTEASHREAFDWLVEKEHSKTCKKPKALEAIQLSKQPATLFSSSTSFNLKKSLNHYYLEKKKDCVLLLRRSVFTATERQCIPEALALILKQQGHQRAKVMYARQKSGFIICHVSIENLERIFRDTLQLTAIPESKLARRLGCVVL